MSEGNNLIMKKMEIKHSWSDLPLDIKNKLCNANIFYSGKYEKFERRRGNNCIYVYNDIAIIVIIIWRKLFFKWGEMPTEPFYYINVNNDEVESVERVFLDDVMKVTNHKEFYWLGASGTAAIFHAYPAKSTRIPFGNYIVDLSRDEEELFSALNGKCRNMIRRAERDGVEISFGGKELLDKYIVVDKDTWERSDMREHSQTEYENYFDSFDNNSRIYIAEKDGVVQGGAIFIFNKEMSYYLYGASIRRPSPGALNLLQYRAMMDFKSEGVHFHNFVGCRINEDPDSKYHGIQKFKGSFGGELVEGYMFKDVDNSILYKLFVIAYRIKNRSECMPKDIIDQEIHKWRNINEEDRHFDIP